MKLGHFWMKVGRGCDFLACINNTEWLLCVWAFWRSLICPDASSEPHATKTQAPVVMTTIWQVLKKNIRYWLFDVKRQIKFVFSHRCARSVLLHLVFYERGQIGLKSILSEFNMQCFFIRRSCSLLAEYFSLFRELQHRCRCSLQNYFHPNLHIS